MTSTTDGWAFDPESDEQIARAVMRLRLGDPEPYGPPREDERALSPASFYEGVGDGRAAVLGAGYGNPTFQQVKFDPIGDMKKAGAELALTAAKARGHNIEANVKSRLRTILGGDLSEPDYAFLKDHIARNWSPADVKTLDGIGADNAPLRLNRRQKAIFDRWFSTLPANDPRGARLRSLYSRYSGGVPVDP